MRFVIALAAKVKNKKGRVSGPGLGIRAIGCGGLQPSELVNSVVPVRVNSYGCLASVNDAMNNFFPPKRASAF